MAQVEVWGHTCKPQKGLWSSWSYATPSPLPPALLPTHDSKAQGCTHFPDEDTEVEKSQALVRGHTARWWQSPASLPACSLPLCAKGSLQAKGWLPCWRWGMGCSSPSRSPIHTSTLNLALWSGSLGIKQHSCRSPNSTLTPFQVLHKLAPPTGTHCTTLFMPTHPPTRGGPGMSPACHLPAESSDGTAGPGPHSHSLLCLQGPADVQEVH